MSKRIRPSLLSSLSHPHPALRKCSALFPTTTSTIRGNPHHHRLRLQQPPPLRPFSSTTPRPIGAKRMVTAGKKSQPSMAIQLAAQQANAMRDGTMLDHLGLMDMTFIPPSGKNLPSYLSDFRTRWKLQKYRLRSFLDELRAYFAAYWYVRPRPKFEKRKIPGIAQELYEGMYRHFAQGTIAEMEGKLAPGMMGSLKNRLSERKANTALKWTLHRYYGRPELMSYKFTVLPDEGGPENKMGIAQAVVKIKSKQSLQHVQRMQVKNGPQGRMTVKEIVVDESGKPIPEDQLEEHREKSAKVTTEFLVVQRLMKKSRFGPWHIWGTTEESTVGKMKKQEEDVRRKMIARQKMKR